MLSKVVSQTSPKAVDQGRLPRLFYPIILFYPLIRGIIKNLELKCKNMAKENIFYFLLQVIDDEMVPEAGVEPALPMENRF